VVIDGVGGTIQCGISEEPGYKFAKFDDPVSEWEKKTVKQLLSAKTGRKKRHRSGRVGVIWILTNKWQARKVEFTEVGGKYGEL